MKFYSQLKDTAQTGKDKKMTDIKVTIKDGKAELYTPYNADFVKAIKALGGARWNASKRCWTISEDMLTQAREIMMDVYGYTDEEQGETITAKVTFAKDVYEECDSVVILGKTVARAYGRDTGAKPGEDVLLQEGTLASGGSRANWRSIVRAGAVVTLYNVSKALYDAKKDSLPEGVTVEIVEEGKKEKEKEETAMSAETLAEKVEKAMIGEKPEYIEVVKKDITAAYAQKTIAKNEVDEAKAMAFVCGSLSAMCRLHLIGQKSAEAIAEIVKEIF